MHTYARSQQDDGRYLYVVGYWSPAAYNQEVAWEPLIDCTDERDAMSWVNYLNGGTGAAKTHTRKES